MVFFLIPNKQPINSGGNIILNTPTLPSTNKYTILNKQFNISF